MVRGARKGKEGILVQEDCGGRMSQAFEFQYFDQPDIPSGWNPNMDIFETHKDLFVLIEAAGLQEDSLHLHAVDNRLIISGERRLEIDEAILRYHQLEILFMPFQKTIILPGSVDEKNVEATYRNGMLSIRVEKRHLK